MLKGPKEMSGSIIHEKIHFSGVLLKKQIKPIDRTNSLYASLNLYIAYFKTIA